MFEANKPWVDGRGRVKNALRSRGYIQGMPEFSTSAAATKETIQLFNTHIPFPFPILENKVKDLNQTTTKMQITSAVMEAATVEAHG